MTVPAVTDQVDHEVLAKTGAIRNRHLGNRCTRRNVIGVNMHHWYLVASGDIGGIRTRIGIVNLCRESDLVVGDYMHRAAHAVTAQIHQIQCLRHYALPCECSIAVYQKRHGGQLRVLIVSRTVLYRTNSTQDGRRHHLQVARIRQ